MADNGYQGPGKAFSTIGGWFVGGLLADIVAVPLMMLGGPVLFGIGVGLSLLGHVVGAVKGYQHAAQGERQYGEAQQQAFQAIAARYNYQQPEVSNSRFTDRIQSKAAEGNYTDAVLADRANAAEQTR